MIFDQRIRSSSYALAALALGACTTLPAGDPSSSGPDPGVEIDTVARHRAPPPPPPDAGTTADASSPTGGTGGDPTQPGVISCYTEGNPGATCTSPSVCCFSDYSSAHDGWCSTSASTCGWASETCDGPEDCASGEHCCGHVLIDPDLGIFGYRIACQASACGDAPLNEEMCHPTATSAAGTCSTGTSCVISSGNDTDVPPNLHICR